MEIPHSFTDEMISGAFHGFSHKHEFTEEDDKTLMTDVFEYKSPFGILGRFVDIIFLERYMTTLLQTRNAHLKNI